MPSDSGKLSMLADGTIVRYQFGKQTDYHGVEFHAEVHDGYIQIQGESKTPSGAAGAVNKLVRDKDVNRNGWTEWEWNPGNGEWCEIDVLRD